MKNIDYIINMTINLSIFGFDFPVILIIVLDILFFHALSELIFYVVVIGFFFELEPSNMGQNATELGRETFTKKFWSILLFYSHDFLIFLLLRMPFLILPW